MDFSDLLLEQSTSAAGSGNFAGSLGVVVETEIVAAFAVAIADAGSAVIDAVDAVDAAEAVETAAGFGLDEKYRRLLWSLSFPEPMALD